MFIVLLFSKNVFASIYIIYKQSLYPVYSNTNSQNKFKTNIKTTDSFKFKTWIIVMAGNNGTKNVELTVPLKCLSNFCRTFQSWADLASKLCYIL